MLASQRIETFIGGWFWTDTKSHHLLHHVEELPTKRGAKPTFIEWLILSWVSGEYPESCLLLKQCFDKHFSAPLIGLIWSEMKQLWDVGLQEYLNDMWNVIDFVTNSLYVATVALRVVSFFQVRFSLTLCSSSDLSPPFVQYPPFLRYKKR